MDGLADLDKKFEALFGGESGFVAKLSDGHALDEFHDEVGAAYW